MNTPTPLEQLIALVTGGHWLPLIIMATLLFRKWASDTSKFPISIPTRWLPSVSAFGGLLYGVELAVQSGMGVAAALLQCAVMAGSTGFVDGLLVAIFDHDNAPRWARAIVFVFDDLTGRGTTADGKAVKLGSRPPPPVVRYDGSLPLRGKSRGVLPVAGGVLVLALTVAFLPAASCKAPGALPPNLPQDGLQLAECVAGELVAGDYSVTTIFAKCGGDGEQTIAAIISWLLSSQQFKSEHPTVIEPAKIEHRKWLAAHPAPAS